MATVGLFILGIFIISLLLVWLRRFLHLKSLIDKLQGPTDLPIIGNVHQFRFNPDEFFEQAQGIAYMLNHNGVRMCRIWLANMPMILLYGAEECEAVLNSNKLLSKTMQYSFLSPWIGNGLLISEPAKWRPRRKLLTPTFHYDILKDFIDVYTKHAYTLRNKFMQLVDNEYHDIFHMVSLCTLDVICEAALGKNINAQMVHTPYLDAVFKMKYIIFQRQLKPYYYPNILFDLFGKGREQKKWVKILHELTSKVIAERKKMVDDAGGVAQLLENERTSGNRRMAFLDLMLDMHSRNELTIEGIQEEVDTFTFEGHDTTSASINWFLHLMGANPDIQRKVHEELDAVFGDSDRDISYDDLSSLVYLECCIKETLRLYPSVPLFARYVKDDTIIKGYLLPAGTNVVIIPSMVHRDATYWSDPEVFNPDRFLESNAIRHPYAYIPFSAGSRNCIGQRFAIMEEKCILSLLLRQLKVKSKLRTDQMRISAELIIRPMYGNQISFERRSCYKY